MKKTEIMLVAIAILGAIGGVLAFKVNKIDDQYCTLTIDGGPGFCTSFFIGLTTFGNGFQYFYTSTDNVEGCSVGNVQCLSSATFIQG